MLHRHDIAKQIMNLSIALFFLALTGFAALLTVDVHRMIQNAPAQIAGIVNGQGNALRDSLNDQMNAMRTMLAAQVSGLSTSLDSRLASIQDDPKSNIGTFHIDLGSTLEPLRADLNKHLERMDKLVDSSVLLTNSYKSLADSMNGAVITYQASAPQFYNRTSLLLFHADNLAQRTDLALPKFIESGQATSSNVSGITADVHALTQKVVAPQTKKGQAWALFRILLNPVAWVTTRF
jgi:hypothetical protein